MNSYGCTKPASIYLRAPHNSTQRNWKWRSPLHIWICKKKQTFTRTTVGNAWGQRKKCSEMSALMSHGHRNHISHFRQTASPRERSPKDKFKNLGCKAHKTTDCWVMRLMADVCLHRLVILQSAFKIQELMLGWWSGKSIWVEQHNCPLWCWVHLSQ